MDIIQKVTRRTALAICLVEVDVDVDVVEGAVVEEVWEVAVVADLDAAEVAAAAAEDNLEKIIIFVYYICSFQEADVDHAEEEEVTEWKVAVPIADIVDGHTVAEDVRFRIILKNWNLLK